MSGFNPQYFTGCTQSCVCYCPAADKTVFKATAPNRLGDKGLEAQTGRLLQEVAVDVLGEDYPLAVISGPTFAMEVAQGLPTAVAVAGTQNSLLKI